LTKEIVRVMMKNIVAGIYIELCPKIEMGNCSTNGVELLVGAIGYPQDIS
jgi:hypothetical protein